MGQPGETAGMVMEDRVGQPGVLASDADRGAAAGLLSSAFAEGRLTSGEHAERVRATYGARTLGELAGLTADLPGPAGQASGLPAVLVPVMGGPLPAVRAADLLPAGRDRLAAGAAPAGSGTVSSSEPASLPGAVR